MAKRRKRETVCMPGRRRLIVGFAVQCVSLYDISAAVSAYAAERKRTKGVSGERHHSSSVYISVTAGGTVFCA